MLGGTKGGVTKEGPLPKDRVEGETIEVAAAVQAKEEAGVGAGAAPQPRIRVGTPKSRRKKESW